MSDIRVEVVYALPERQYLRKVKLAEGSSVEQAIQASGLLELRGISILKATKSAFTAARPSWAIR